MEKQNKLAIFPEDAKYLERNFVWRLSTATCEKEESDFSRLPDFDRVLMVLKGEVVLAHQDVRVARLSELDQDSFDGGYHTKSFGQITDYNLMVAKGNKGLLDVIVCDESSQTPEVEVYPEYERFTQTYFCRDGYAAVTLNGDTHMLVPGQQLVVNGEKGETVEISVMGDGHLVRGQIFYNYHPEEMGPTIIPKEKATFDDYLACVFIANTQFRGAKYIFKKLKNQWMDEALSSVVHKIESFYITFIVATVGLTTICFVALNHLHGWQWAAAIIGWLLFDIFIVSPLIYFAAVPKPVRKHIKDVNNLTPYEQGVREKELNTNERMDKLLKKYKNSGRAVYDKDGNCIIDGGK